MTVSMTQLLAPDRQILLSTNQLWNEAVEVVDNATGYKCAILPATNDLNVVQIPKIYMAVQCILNIFTSAFMQIMNLLTKPIFTMNKCIF